MYPKPYQRDSVRDPGFAGCLLWDEDQSLWTLFQVRSPWYVFCLPTPPTLSFSTDLHVSVPVIWTTYSSFLHCVISCLLDHVLFSLGNVIVYSGIYLVNLFSSFKTQLTSLFSEAFVNWYVLYLSSIFLVLGTLHGNTLFTCLIPPNYNLLFVCELPVSSILTHSNFVHLTPFIKHCSRH